MATGFRIPLRGGAPPPVQRPASKWPTAGSVKPAMAMARQVTGGQGASRRAGGADPPGGLSEGF